MLAKFVFAWLVLSFGLAMFGAGLSAPSSVRAPLGGLAARAAAPLQVPYLALKEKVFGAVEEVAGQRPKLQRVESYAELLVTTATPKGTQYGIQVGLYAERSEALALAASLRELGHTTHLIALGKPELAEGYVLAVAPFSSLSAAQLSLQQLRLQLPAAARLAPHSKRAGTGLVLIGLPAGASLATTSKKRAVPAGPNATTGGTEAAP